MKEEKLLFNLLNEKERRKKMEETNQFTKDDDGVVDGRYPEGPTDLEGQSQEAEPIEETKPTHTFFIAGVQHHRMHSVLGALEEGETLQLVPEPTNKFDPNAVRIEFNTGRDQVMLGFVPRKFSSEVTAMVTVGKTLECVISMLNKTAKPWEMCKVEIREVNG